jgi:hypothetical protein
LYGLGGVWVSFVCGVDAAGGGVGGNRKSDDDVSPSFCTPHSTQH